MVDFTPDGQTIYRDFITDGVPESGARDVPKSEERDWATLVEATLNDHDSRIAAMEDSLSSFIDNSGKTTIDFGAFPGTSDTSLDITGQTGLTTASSVRAWIEATDTVDHSADEHLIDPPIITVGNLSTGGFTIYATAAETIEGDTPYGQYTIAWTWVN